MRGFPPPRAGNPGCGAGARRCDHQAIMTGTISRATPSCLLWPAACRSAGARHGRDGRGGGATGSYALAAVTVGARGLPAGQSATCGQRADDAAGGPNLHSLGASFGLRSPPRHRPRAAVLLSRGSEGRAGRRGRARRPARFRTVVVAGKFRGVQKKRGESRSEALTKEYAGRRRSRRHLPRRGRRVHGVVGPSGAARTPCAYSRVSRR